MPTGAVNYTEQKKAVELQKTKINDNLSDINSNLEDAKQLGNSLKEEINSKNAEMTKTETAISDVNTLVATLDQQIADNQKLIDETIESIKSIFLEMQKQRSPFQTLLSSENLADAISQFYSTSVLQSKADEYRVKLEEANTVLESNKKDQLEAKTKLEQTKALLASQQSYLVDLREKTQNDEAKYQQLKKSLIDQNKQLEAQLANIEKQRLAEEAAAEAARKKAEEEAKKNTSNGGSSNGGGSGNSGSGTVSTPGMCWFEDKRALNVPDGYLGSPAKGFLVRAFDSCQHDAVDIANGTGTPLLAIANGVVEDKGSYNIVGYGHYVVIKIVLPSGQTIYTLYAHMSSSSPLSVGQGVSKGQQVGSMGCTGECFGTHVHFMIYSDTYKNNGAGCRLGSSKCYNPIKYIDL